MPCPHGQRSTPASCSQCIGAVVRVVRSDGHGVVVDGVAVRPGSLDSPADVVSKEAAPPPRPATTSVDAIPELPTPMLAQSEIDRLVMAVARGMGTFSEDDARRVVQWAQRIRFETAVLELVLSGVLVVSVPHGHGEPEFTLAKDAPLAPAGITPA